MENYIDKRIHNLKTIAFNQYFAFIPENYDIEIQKDIRSCFAKNFIGLSSVEYTKKKYGSDKIPENGPSQVLLENFTNDIWNLFEKINYRLDNLIIKNKTNITLGITSNLMRLVNSYESSIFLIKNQFFFESISITRMIFEQLNYCYNLSLLDNNDFSKNSKNNIRKKLKSTNINNLKKLFPNAELGSFYSYLSEVAHLDYNQVSEYIELEDDTQNYNVVYKSVSQSFQAGFVLLRALDFHCMLFEYMMVEFGDINFEYIDRIDNVLNPKPERETKIISDKYLKLFNELAESQDLNKGEFRKSKVVDKDSDLPF